MITCPMPYRDRETDEILVCSGPTYAATALCPRHYGRLGQDLRIIDQVLRWIGDDPNGWLTRPVTDSQPGKPTRIGSPAPGRIDVISATDKRAAAMQAIHGWARDVAHTDRALDRVECARLLLAHHDTIACHPALPEIADELHDAALILAALPDEHWNSAEQDARPRDLGPCREQDPANLERRCRGRRHWRPGTVSVYCDHCGHTEQGDGYITKRLALAAFGISERTLRRWIEKGLVAEIDRHVYIDDIRTCVALMRHAKSQGA